MNKKTRSLAVPGVSLLLLLFVSFCLVTFALLSYSGSTADSRLGEKAAQRTQEYYRASSEASKYLSQIDQYLAEQLRQGQQQPDPENAYLTSWKHLASLLGIGTLEEESFSFPVSLTDTQILRISLLLSYPENPKDPLFTITEWKTVNISEWTPDTSIDLFIP